MIRSSLWIAASLMFVSFSAFAVSDNDFMDDENKVKNLVLESLVKIPYSSTSEAILIRDGKATLMSAEEGDSDVIGGCVLILEKDRAEGKREGSTSVGQKFPVSSIFTELALSVVFKDDSLFRGLLCIKADQSRIKVGEFKKMINGVFKFTNS